MAESKLTPKQQAFVDAYVACGFNGSEAARRAGYAPANANVEASRLLANVNIRVFINQHIADLRNTLEQQELADFRAQHAQWNAVWKEAVSAPAGDNAKVLRPIDWLRLSEWRREISKQGRLALGMPDTISRNELTEADVTPKIVFEWADDEQDNSGHGE